MVKGFTAIGLAVVLSGCSALETHETQAWLALHAVDTVQTYRAAQDPQCFAEGDGITRGLIGEHPSSSEVLAWSVGSAGVHLAVTEWLLRTDHPKIAKAWQYVRIGVTASAIAQNHSIGIRIGSPNQPAAGTCLEASPAPSSPSENRPRPIG